MRVGAAGFNAIIVVRAALLGRHTRRANGRVNMNSADTRQIKHAVHNGILHAKVVGTATVDDMAAYAESNIDDWSAAIKVLWDVTGLRFYAINLKEIKRIVDAFSNVTRSRSGCHTAILFSKKEESLGNIVHEFSKHSPVTKKIFTVRVEAEQWLQSITPKNR
jgi:hypothetical protein